MTIQYCSDLHLEFPENSTFIKANPIVPKGEVLILAGDIIPFHSLGKADWFFDRVSNDFEQVYWIPGNHEYYHSDVNDWKGTFQKYIRDNVMLLNNTAIDLDGVKLVFSTLWSKISEQNKWQIRELVNDFRLIKESGHPLSVDQFNRMHEEAKTFMASRFNIKDRPTVVVTHHVPTFMKYPTEYAGSLINEAFVTELDEMIISSQVDYWIYGHHHVNVPEFTQGKTRLLTNQLGYVHRQEHDGYSDKVLTI